MIKIALFGVVIVIGVGSAVLLMDRLADPVDPPVAVLETRFPNEWASLPVVEYRKPLRWPSAVSEVNAMQFEAALAAVDRLKPPPKPPQPDDAVFNDAQIASIRDRLSLTEEQEPYWHPVEEALREVTWNRKRANGPTLDADSVDRFREVAVPLLNSLNARQKSEIRALANVVGLRLDAARAQ